jgi:hypothetical protein
MTIPVEGAHDTRANIRNKTKMTAELFFIFDAPPKTMIEKACKRILGKSFDQ